METIVCTFTLLNFGSPPQPYSVYKEDVDRNQNSLIIVSKVMFGINTSISEIIYYTNSTSILPELCFQRFNFQLNFGSILCPTM